MRIDSAKYEGGRLVLSTLAPDAIRLAYRFEPGEYELVKAKKKRSLDANSYLWVLCTKIADAVRISKEDVYRRNIREGGEYTPLPIKSEAVEEFQRIWAGHGIGWFADVTDDSKIAGYKLVFAYHGSSVYDTKQMSHLLQRVIDDAKSVGIDVISEREQSLMIGEWK
ncbi:hypothetical protein SAMN02745823_03837 [Sporobacter termitidis DSM 10068]|uniref:Uncharacterized protein n=1 Tax=Sporobacter termitidis DSM 10068 TaxID=1123282 RepID=A0A1M5ZJH7_9FIRM|nr:hypothetical protein [Sporobacter termitidis]SHI23757.1 hypothetical protein SAMN02745823_03759 [Sporobacter termitidis DSM 10068]SHI24447.1 hypothetical protein SAMN02745823_03837 [Sporobacter termitidis DSM 10068]